MSCPRERLVRVEELNIHVARHGEGPPLLLVNGIGGNIKMWEPIAKRLSGYELVLFDCPGTGRSTRTRRPVRMPTLARILEGLLDRLALDRVDVLGYSFGGLLAQQLAHSAPGRVRRQVLCATSAGIPAIPPGPLVTAMMLTPARYYHPKLAELIVPRIAGGRTARDPAVLRRNLSARIASPPDPIGYAYQLWAATGWSSQCWLHCLTQSTLVVHGSQDPVVPVINARWLAHRIPNAELHIVPGAGHLVLLDDPDRVIETVEAFLDAPDHAGHRNGD